MARWDNQRRSDNVRNRRGSGGGGAAGAGAILLLLRFIFSKFGIAGIVVLGVAYVGLKSVGIDPLQLLTGTQVAQTSSGSGAPPTSRYDDEVAAVLGSTEDVWRVVFREENINGGVYPEPTLNFFTQGIRSGCGFAPSAVGPFYCPADQMIYIDTAFFDQLRDQLGARGDFPRAYVVAHEVGHHVQNVIGVLGRAPMRGDSKNENQVRIELQADCFAGLWARSDREHLEPGDIEEALDAAARIGDDALQRRAGQRVNTDSFTHGSSEQRRRWFGRGFETGAFEACDTFGMPYGQL